MRGVGGLACALAACLLLGGCRNGTPNPPGAIQVGLADFKVSMTITTANAGDITFHMRNDGPSTHEINIDRTDLAAGDLPLRADGLSVAEDSPSLKRIGSIEIIEAGEVKNLKVNLPPGHYVLYCNLEGHYLGQMHATIDVH
jgi:uncharacterized cupredoxin-like copper-binding protein